MKSAYSKWEEMTDLQTWKTLSSQELLARPPGLRVSGESVQLPDGRIIDDYYQIELPEYAVVFARTAEGTVVMERLYKHGTRRIILALPAGYLEPGEAPLEGAKRELLEETGYEADNWCSLGIYVVNSNYGCGKAHIYLARGARKIQNPDSNDLEDTEIVLMTPKEVIQAVINGQVATLSGIASIALALNPAFVE